MWRATVKGVIARKVRLLLTALAIVLGVAFVSGTYVLTDTLQTSLNGVFAQTAVGVDLVVRTPAPFGDDGGQRERIPDGIVTQVRAVPGVAAAQGGLLSTATIVTRDGPIQNAGAPTIGLSWGGSGGEVGPLRLKDGRAPQRDGEVAVDAGTAGRSDIEVGDRVRILATKAAQPFRVVGLFGFGESFDLGSITAAAFDLKTAQRLFEAPGLVDYVNVRVADGAMVPQVRRELRDRLGPGYEITNAATVAAEQQKPLDEALGALNDALLGFAGVGVLVGGFIIFNTFTILISQRTRELGLLRALGAGGKQVVGSVLVEAAVVGLLASALGFLLGIGLAVALLWLLPKLGLMVPTGGLVVIGRTLWVSAIVGVGVTVAAAIYPAVRAARTPPVAAIGDLRRTPGPAPIILRSVLGVLVIALGVGVLLYGVYGNLVVNLSVAVSFIGGFVIFIGIVVLGPLVARPLAGLVGRPLPSVIGVTGTLARGNAMRNPRRTSATAAALVVGLGLVSLVAIFADSVKASVRSALASSVKADYIITAPQFASFSTDVRDRVAKLPGVERAVGMRFADARINGRAEYVTGVDPRGLGDVLDLDFSAGSASDLTPGTVLISERESDFYGPGLGETLTVEFPRLGPQGLRVVGVYENQRVTGAFPVSFILPNSFFRDAFGGVQQDTLVYVKAEPGQAAAVGRELRQSLRGPFPNVGVDTLDQYRAEREATINQFLNVFIALLLLSEVIAVLGIVNTLMLSVYERTREIGLLRACGMSRVQIRRMIRGESVIIAVMGCAVGIAVGVGWGWAVVNALRGRFVDEFSVPPAQLVLFVIASAIAGLIAALLPAWHASRLDVLEAIAHE